jgi:hypothetical protein
MRPLNGDEMTMTTIATISILLAAHALAQNTSQTVEKQIAELEARQTDLHAELSQVASALEGLRSKLAQLKVADAIAKGIVIRAQTLYDETPVFDKPFVFGNVIAKLPKGTEVRVLGKPALWEVVAGDVHGFVGDVAPIDKESAEQLGVLTKTKPMEYTPSNPRPLTSSGTAGATTPSNVTAPPSSSTARPSSPSRSSTQCLGTTKKGARCKRMTTDPSGYCYQHK